jgi:hypothetical protein
MYYVVALGYVQLGRWFISGSSGTFIPNDGDPHPYYNEPGKDAWTLKKNPQGCWVIVHFRFS